MNKKILAFTATIIGVALGACAFETKVETREPIIITSNPSYPEMALDDLITEANLIVIGSPERIQPSRWNTLDGKLPKGTTLHTIAPDKIIFTDVDFRLDQVLKGQENEKVVRIRSLGGTVDRDQMIVSGVASLETGVTYLLFLGEDISGSTADIDPGNYFVRGGLQGLYQISDGTAISFRDTWKLEDLVAYTQNLLSTDSSTRTPLPITASPVPTEPSTQAPPPTEIASPTP